MTMSEFKQSILTIKCPCGDRELKRHSAARFSSCFLLALLITLVSFTLFGIYIPVSCRLTLSAPKCHLLKECLLRLSQCCLLFPSNWKGTNMGSEPLQSPPASSAESLSPLFLEWPTWCTRVQDSALQIADFDTPDLNRKIGTEPNKHTSTSPPWTGQGLSWRPFITATQTHACWIHTQFSFLA